MFCKYRGSLSYTVWETRLRWFRSEKILKLQFSILTRLKKLQINLVWNAGEQKHQYVPRKTDLSDAGSVWDQWGSCWDGNCWAPFIFGVKWGDGINRGFDLSYYIQNIIQQHVDFVLWSIILIKITLTPYSFSFRNQDEENSYYLNNANTPLLIRAARKYLFLAFI